MTYCFSDHCIRMLEIIEDEKKRFGVAGSELLLLAIAKSANSACKFILNEYGVNGYSLENELDRIIILRKKSKEGEYTSKFDEIIKNANAVAAYEGSKYIFDEHLFYALLTTSASTALHILKKMGIDIDDLIEEVNNIYSFTPSGELNKNYLINITKEAKLNRLNPFIGRHQIIDKIIRILSKKQKNNPMLIGSAGVGKSALVEGVTMRFLDINPGVNIYRLDLGMIIAGTKYRGDLEERMLEVIEKIKNPNSIVFIDEIHNIVGSGSSEGTLDIANILKPILARSEIKCIGATTLEEYYRYIEKDKALSRRFQNVFVDEASPGEAYEIIKGIAPKYEEYHHVKYNDSILKYIIDSSNFLTNRKLPDKAIDILDEAGLLCNLNERVYVTRNDVDKIVYENLGIDYDKIKENLHMIKNYYFLDKYYNQYFMNLGIRKTIVNVQTADAYVDLFIEDLHQVFWIKDEMILTLDLGKFTEGHFTSSLIGSPAGYVGYEDGGILTEHVLKFPLAVIIVKNYSIANNAIIKQMDAVLRDGKIVDSKGRTISFQNCFFVFLEEEKNKAIGFIMSEEKNNKINPYIDEVLYPIEKSMFYQEKLNDILNKMSKYNYNITVDIKSIDYSIYHQLIKELSNFDNFRPNKKYIFKMNKNKTLVKTAKRS
ncbi:MAG: AAA family ATPase [Bacilli bacterium]|nr:AAA family ATPase [Bacilli bacterium]